MDQTAYFESALTKMDQLITMSTILCALTFMVFLFYVLMKWSHKK